MMLYLYPPRGTQNYGLSFGGDLFQSMYDEVKDWDMDQFLPIDTSKWCQEYLQSINFSHATFQLKSVEARINPLFNEYIRFREAIQRHIDTGEEPHLYLLPPPTVENLAVLPLSQSVIQEFDVDLDV